MELPAGPARHDERLDDRVAAEIRTRLLQQIEADTAAAPARAAAARRGRPGWRLPALMTALVAVVAVAVAVAALLVPRRVEPADPGLPQWRMFHGSCSSLLSPADAARLVGTPLRPPVDTARSRGLSADATFAPLYAVGGLRCDWTSSAGGDDQAALTVVAVPSSLAPPHAGASAPYCYASSDGGPDQTTCTFNRRTRGTWFTGLLTTETGTDATVRARLRELDTALTRAAARTTPAPLPSRPPESWPRRIDCATLVRDAGLSALLHAATVGEPGNGATEQPAGQTAAASRLGATPCIADGDRSFEFTVLPASAARLSGLLATDPNTRTVALGAGRSLTSTTDPDGTTVLWAIDGIDALQVLPDRTSSRLLRPAVAALLERLDRTRDVPTQH